MMGNQREQFEAWYFEQNYKNTTACKLKVFEQFSGLVGDEASYNNTYLNQNTQISWQAWQQAQKSAVPKGFVLMPIQPTDEMIEKATYEFIDLDIENIEDRIVFSHQAMIEAQEQAQ